MELHFDLSLTVDTDQQTVTLSTPQKSWTQDIDEGINQMLRSVAEQCLTEELGTRKDPITEAITRLKAIGDQQKARIAPQPGLTNAEISKGALAPAQLTAE